MTSDGYHAREMECKSETDSVVGWEQLSSSPTGAHNSIPTLVDGEDDLGDDQQPLLSQKIADRKRGEPSFTIIAFLRSRSCDE